MYLPSGLATINDAESVKTLLSSIVKLDELNFLSPVSSVLLCVIVPCSSSLSDMYGSAITHRHCCLAVC